MDEVIYADFTSPAAYLAGLRLDALAAAGEPVPDWRPVAWHPRLPRTGLSLDTEGRANQQRAVERVRSLTDPREEFPASAPGFLPHPDGPISAYAEAYLAGVGPEVRRLLLQAYWVEHRDIGNPEVLRRLLAPALKSGHSRTDAVRNFGYAVSPARMPLSTLAFHLMRDWQQAWQALGTHPDVTLVAPGRPALTGAAALDALGVVGAPQTVSA